MNSEPSQLDRFKEATRQLEADNDETKCNDRLKKIAMAKVPEKNEKQTPVGK
jgi:hypothetical protein